VASEIDVSIPAGQSNPFPGVQMLPSYIACCEEFAYVKHPEYDARAWCRTEQFMHWRLR